jgi:hypothetical protein
MIIDGRKVGFGRPGYPAERHPGEGVLGKQQLRGIKDAGFGRGRIASSRFYNTYVSYV